MDGQEPECIKNRLSKGKHSDWPILHQQVIHLSTFSGLGLYMAIEVFLNFDAQSHYGVGCVL
jgi:hypothetical protein